MNMTLKKKLVVLLLFSGGILILLLYGAFQATMRPSLEDQKLIFIENLKKKIHIALDIEEENIDIHCANWANLDSMAHYVKNPSREFEDEVFPDMIFTDDIIDVVMVVKVAASSTEEEILFYKGLKDKQFLPLNRMDIVSDTQRIKEIMKGKPRAIKSLLNSGAGPLIIVANPIFAAGKLSGILIMGRFIDDKMLEKMSQFVMEDIKSFSPDIRVVRAFHLRDMKRNDLFYRENKDKLTIYYVLKDLRESPGMILYTRADNRLFRVVTQHFIIYVLITALSIAFLGMLLYLSIQKYIVLRMLNISSTMNKIESLADLSRRITEDKKHDEISHLISSINLMLDKLENEKIKRETAEKTMITQGKLVSIGRLASCIGHEVNNPLLAIANSLQVIKKTSRSKSPLFKEAVEISESEIERIRDLISSLLDFHRLDKDEFANLEVKDILVKSLDVLRWSKKLGSATIIQKMDDGCMVHGSSAKLKQVFINFILNAVEAMGSENTGPGAEPGAEPGADTNPGGTLTIIVRCSRGKKNVEIHFLDTGPGIPEKIKGHLFEPFVSTKEAKGVGLGLYISYRIIENHNGEIIYNEYYKKGTHFIIKLPAINAEEGCS